MPRRLIPALLLVTLTPLLPAQIWPSKWSEHTQIKTEPLAVEDKSLFTEYGGQAAEKAIYQGPAGKFTASAWRLADSTSALAWFQALRPENAVPVRGSGALTVTTPGAQIIAHQNYVLQFEGWRPTASEMKSLLGSLPSLHSGGGLPVVTSYLPEKERIRNSERFILGITSLARFEPRISPVLAGFEQGAEAQLARYRTPSGAEESLLIFTYPTPQIARQRAAELEKLPGAVLRRSSSYIAIVPEAKSQPDAEKLVASVNYGNNFIWNQATKAPPMPDVGGMLIAIFELTGVLLVVCLGGGILFAAAWIYIRRRGARLAGTESTMTVLNIDNR